MINPAVVHPAAAAAVATAATPDTFTALPAKWAWDTAAIIGGDAMTVTAATNPFLDSILNPTNVHVIIDNDAATAAITDSNAASVTASRLAKCLR